MFRFAGKLNRYFRPALRIRTSPHGLADAGNTTYDVVAPDRREVSEPAELHAQLRKQHVLTLQQDELLRVRNLQFDMAINNISLGLCFFDGSRRLIVCNSRYVEMYGLDPAVVIPGITLREVVELRFAAGSSPSMSRDEYLAWRDNIADSNMPGDSVVKLNDGRYFRLRQQSMPDGGWVATHEDVTDREVAVETSRRVLQELEDQNRVLQERERDLNDRNRRFDIAISNMAQGLCMFDAQLRVVDCNDRYRALFNVPAHIAKRGASLRDMIAYSVGDGRLPGQTVDAIMADRLAIFAKGEPATLRTKGVDGTRTIETVYRPIDEGGWVATYEDITEREIAEFALARQNRCFDAALSNMSQGLCMFDAAQRLIVCNRQYASLFGLTEEQTRPGTTLRAIQESRIANGGVLDQREINERIGRIAEEKPYQARSRLPDGRTVSIVHRPMAGGGWLATFEDVTDIERAEAERARAVAGAEMFRARELAAEAANKAKSSFLAVMSHEIRTPMNAVIGLSSVLLESNLNGEQRRIADTIHESSDRLLSLLDDILDFSKLDAGRVEFETVPFSLRTVIDNAASIVASRAHEKKLAIRCVFDDGVPAALVGDQTRIRQVILNLMANAIKFTSTGVVEISARCLARVNAQASIECSVRDTGIGIAPDQIGNLFGDFAQADSSINRRFGGTGLGLAISRRIVEQMGGEIGVESTLGVGTTFRFTLTLPTAEMSELGGPGAAANNGDSVRALANLDQPLRVMLAEDNATNQLVFSKMMQGFNVDVTIAANGREALQLASSRTFDVVFMDMRMPEMDGLEATRAIRALGGPWAHIPIVALTANAFADDVKACRDAGMNEFISKPMRKKILVEKLTQVLADHPLLVQAAKSAPLQVSTG